MTAAMPITTRFGVIPAPAGSGVIWSTTYTGARAQLLKAGLATATQFPQQAKARSSSNGAHPESGRWYLWQEQPTSDIWSITYYTPGFVDELDIDELRRLQRHLLNDLQIRPETIGAIVLQWRQKAAEKNDDPTSGHAGSIS